MQKNVQQPPFALSGRFPYRLRSFINLLWASLATTVRRWVRGPLLPGWSWDFETSMHFLRAQSAFANRLHKPSEMREFEDSLAFNSPALSQVAISRIEGPVKGRWFTPRTGSGNNVILYLHGGGYAFYVRAHDILMALVALATHSRLFALDYRLAPEHAFPAQVEDAQAAYHWLIEQGIAPEQLVVIGDSAGGNLTLSLLLALRAANSRLPAAAVCVAPWTDLANPGASMTTNARYDWISKAQADLWASWYYHQGDVADPMISPIHAQLSMLPPIYIQVGSAEILYDMIQTFYSQAKAQGASIRLDVWEGMTHDFQIYGDSLKEAQEALTRIGQFVAEQTT